MPPLPLRLPTAASAEDDDNDFDWEAAVREIDSACQAASASASASAPGRRDATTPVAATPHAGVRPNPAKLEGKARQSTLERFVDSFTKRKKAAEDCPRSSVRESNVPVGPGRVGYPEDREIVPAVEIDPEAAKTWIYPVNVPLRDYQFSIARTALFSNTLVALPTGLGKTLIAAVVMFNYFRWFPEGKIVFAAPSRPLVVQQIEACHNIVGIPQEWAIDMTGLMNPSKRSNFWKSKRVFFVTPQVLDRDIQSGICLVKQLVCLVIDEAHRALGNHSYCVAVRELMAVPVPLRILALTATPGSKQHAVQNVINNLCISNLEYRDEGDRDVCPYVHNRKLELIQVSMGEDAIAINDLLFEVIRPFVTRLRAIGVLYNRDLSTLSPCEILNLRDKFRQAPPPNLPHAKHQEVEACFGALVTLYHIAKLLSSHGIRPAYEMLEEKLKQGPFARLMSRNETMWKAKLLMQQRLSRGAQNPKLAKMIEILMDHFKIKDPKDSRVIIFSNFRGSIKDIMDSLSDVGGELIKAMEFIGQSSGKTLKGQSQKMQQAVLQKFRSGGYNVIVATSIGEEGLDIMEVDLVICFDANISPLRMIQRMGRTGRKHDGRVVVLACEGTELKGYLRKQANSKAIGKHMHNGGTKSFDFHASPRMIPHVYKPEVQLVELSIEEFIPRGKKAKVDAIGRSPFLKKVSSEENQLIGRYFHASKENDWRPSLVAFPSFQAFPCGVHRVPHSYRTTDMFIDVMQQLHELSFSKNGNDLLLKVESPSLTGLTAAKDKMKKDFYGDGIPVVPSQEKQCVVKPLSKQISVSKIWHSVPHQPAECPPTHSFLFGGGFLTVDDGGCVSIASVPTLPICNEKCTDTRKNSMPHSPEHAEHINHDNKKLVQETPMSKAIIAPSKRSNETPEYIGINSPALLSGGSRSIVRDLELSPRLTRYIEEGIVPESPAVKSNHCTSNCIYKLGPSKLFVEKVVIDEEAPCPEIIHEEGGSCNVQNSFNEMVTELDVAFCPSDENPHTPLANPINSNSSEDWQLSSKGDRGSVQEVPKYRRLCKYGDKIKKLTCSALQEECMQVNRIISNQEEGAKGKETVWKRMDTFIEEEAEVSEDAAVSADEEDNENKDEYEDSFIDDTTNPTEASTQGENNGDMMAFYRRSLLTQSPAEALQRSLAISCGSFSRTESGSRSSENLATSVQTPQNGLPPGSHSEHRNPLACQPDSLKASSTNRLRGTSDIGKESSTKLESRKRKLSFHLASPTPSTNLHKLHQFPQGCSETSNEMLDDDDFYQSVDLDAVEAQATELLRVKSGPSLEKKSPIVPNFLTGIAENPSRNHLNSPSFDLGI